MSGILRRDLAPIAEQAWREIERQSRRVLKGNLSGRKLVDFPGPHGWAFAAVNLGKLEPATGHEADGLAWGSRQVRTALARPKNGMMLFSGLNNLAWCNVWKDFQIRNYWRF